ncbi:MAG: hypothetical protein HRF45_10755 [Fimbriimonadia bacterium]|jgi:hypothetical protein
MSLYLRALVDAVIEARTDFLWWRPVLASLLDQPAFAYLPEDVARELRRFLADGKSATRGLSELWTRCFRALEKGKTPPFSLPEPPEHLELRSERPRDWNQLFALNEIAVILGKAGDDGLAVHDPGIADLSMDDVAAILRRLAEDIEGAGFAPSAVLAHDRESVPIALALAQHYRCGIEPTAHSGGDCLYVFGNLFYAGALERARLLLEEIRPARTLAAAMLLSENPNAMRLIPDVIGLQVGSGALPWGKAAGVGVLLRPDPQLGEEGEAVADPEAFQRSRDRRPLEEIASDLLQRMRAVPRDLYEDHTLLASDVLRRSLARKTTCLRRFAWRALRSDEEASDWHTLLPPFPSLIGTPFSELPDKPTVSMLRDADPEEEQLRFMDWVTPALQKPMEVWAKQDVRGQTYIHYIAGVRDPRVPEPMAFVVETVPYGDETALNNFTLFFDAGDADELRFGRLLHSAEAESAAAFPDVPSLN